MYEIPGILSIIFGSSSGSGSGSCFGSSSGARWIFKGTHQGKFFNVPPTGKVVSYPIIGVYRIQNERIAENWHVFHALGLWETIIPEIGELVKKAMGPQ